ncbi:MAG: teichoic acid biosynthesis protein [Planctomycetes bacterium]|nr:teichoic acid biosynthesis protein [Planctomycetota bacterium]
MRLLYGVVGDGMGHATRSRVVISHLLESGHEVHVLASSRAFGFLAKTFAGRGGFEATEIAGLRMVYNDNKVRKGATAAVTLFEAPQGLRRNAAVWRKLTKGPRPDAVITDFDTFAALLGRHFRVPVVSIDNNHAIDRLRHPRAMLRHAGVDFALAKAIVAARLPRAYHYLIASFFFPPPRKLGTTLVPPILRPEILAARREPGRHVLVYQTASTNRGLIPALRKLPHEFRVYGMGREGREGNVTLCAFSEQGFVDDLRTARAVVAGGGFSLMGEAVHLRVPMLAVPLRGQFEQELNARWLEALGYGARASKVDAESVEPFLARVDEHSQALQGYTPRDNSALFACVDELLVRAAAGERRPTTLDAAPQFG